MPLEIKELHIKVTINQEPRMAEGKPGTHSISVNSSSGEAIITECLEHVSQLLKNKTER